MKNKATLSSRLLMPLLALTPILSQYGIFGLSYASWSMLLVILPVLLTSRKLKNNFLIPEGYMLYWLYLAIDYILITGKLTAVIPGGMNFFTFSVIILFVAKIFDILEYRRCLRLLFLITAGLFLAQEYMWYTTGTRFVPLLPLGKLTTTLTYSEMVFRNLYADRSASVFFEPSHYAVFLLTCLLVEVFTNKGKRWFSNYAIGIVLILLILRSGTGLVGMIVILSFKLRDLLHNTSIVKKIVMIFVFAILSLGSISLYLSTSAGNEMYNRTEELTLDESGHSYSRLAVGMIIYEAQPRLNKIIGASEDELLPAARIFSKTSSDETASMLYMNGWMHVLTHTGILGLLFLLIVLFKLFRKNEAISICGLLLFMVLSLFEQTYCRPIMMIVMIIAIYYQRQKKLVKNYG